MEHYISIIHEINRAIEKFNIYLQPRYHLSLLNVTEITNKVFYTDLINTLWEDQKWPNSDNAGVYFIFGVDENNINSQGVYIGKASLSSKIGHRLHRHLSAYRAKERYLMSDGKGHQYALELVGSIALKDEMRAMIPAFEEFLIVELKEKGVNLLNVIGN